MNIKGVFNRLNCCYGNQCRHENDFNFFSLVMIGHLFDIIVVAATDKDL